MVVIYILSALAAVLLLCFLFLSVCALAVNPKKEYESNSRFYRALLYGATAIAVKITRVRIHVSGTEKIPENTRVLFVSNHRSNFDPILTWHALKKWEIAFVSKAENFKIPFFGRFIRKCCFMAIDRDNPRNAMKTILKAAKLLKKDEVSVGIYPEGTRSKDCVLLPFHNGVFKIAQKAVVPIVVFSVSGTEKIHKNYPLRSSDVYIDILSVISAESVKSMKTDEIGNAVREAIEKSLEGR